MRPCPRLSPIAVVLLSLGPLSASAHAETELPSSSAATPASRPESLPQTAPLRRPAAFEANLLWPLFPGGLSELKLLLPVWRATETNGQGELLVGTYSDFATRFVRADDKYGKVSILAALLGYRQFLISGLHVEAAATPGWRHEEHNVWDGGTLDGFTVRLWLMGGYQYEWSRRVYLNARGGAGIHLYRSDRFAAHERKLAPAGDLNLGLRF